jgi:hypothetical protein
VGVNVSAAMNRHVPVVPACIAGVCLAGVYTLSPLLVWFAAATAVLFVYAGRGLGARERQWVFGLLAAAIGLRLLAIAGMFAMTAPGDGSFPVLIPDEGYAAMRVRLVRYASLGIPLTSGEYEQFINHFGDTRLHQVMAFVQLLVGDSPYGVRLISVAVYVTGAVVVYRAARRAFGGVAAFAGLAGVLLMPSLFVWSISTLKEPYFYCFTMVSVSAAAVTLSPGSPLSRGLAAVICLAAVLAAGGTRAYGDIMLGGGVLLALVSLAVMRRPMAALRIVVLCTAVALGALLVPAARAQVIGAVRAGEQRLQHAVSMLVLLHWGHVETVGWHYKLLDPEFYYRDANGNAVHTWLPFQENFSYGAATRFVLRAAASFVLVPLPWQAYSVPALAYLPEQTLWYLLVPLALIGTAAGLRREPALTLLLAGVSAVGGAGIALTNGNIGTLVRHRGMVVVLLVWLSGLGASVVMKQVAARRGRTVSPGFTEEGLECLS